jgi:monolysocardiolipin acyltransferase
MVMYVLAHGSRAFMTRANSTHVEGAEHMAAALAREAGRPLITVCNHVASMDDPLVMSTILPPAVYSDPAQLRWVLNVLYVMHVASRPLRSSCCMRAGMAHAG